MSTDASPVDPFSRVRACLLEARARSASDRHAYLTELRARDAGLHDEVASLLAFDDGEQTVPAGDAIRALIPLVADDEARTTPPLAGPYTIVRVLGEGGMGTVYLAEQFQPIRRRVALKVIRRGLDTDRLIARFEAERQLLARMDHPGIATVLDAGTTLDGRPYVAMDLVEGPPITTLCRERGLTVDARLDLFLAVCRAVQHAHQKGVIHRDLKPSNILVREVDGALVPTIIDFGIAKALADYADDRGMTQMGAVIGTPEYMSPEQAGVIPGGTDTRTDVYSLGILLFELLTDAQPNTFASYTPAEIQRVLATVEPPRPSSVLTAPGAAALRRRLTGDLDTIAQTAMARLPGERYSSVERLADDVRRHRAGLPILARPTAWPERTAKFVRRHRLGVAFAATTAVLLVSGAILVGVQAARLAEERDRARDAERRAQQEAATAQSVSQFLVELFRTSDPSESRGNTITAREILDRGARRIDAELRSTPDVQATMFDTIGRVYQSLGLYADAERLLSRGLAARRGLYGSDHPLIGESLSRLARLHQLKGDVARAEPLYREALATRQRVLGPEHADVAETLNDLGMLMMDQGRYADAEQLGRQALAMRTKLLGDDHADVATSLHDLGMTLHQKGDHAAAEPLVRQALEIRRRTLGQVHPLVAEAWFTLGSILESLDRPADTEPAFRAALDITRALYPGDHPEIGHALYGLGAFLTRQNQLAAAEPLLRDAVAMHRRTLGTDNTWVAAGLVSLGRLRLTLGDPAGAEPLLRESLAIHRRVAGHDHRSTTATAMLLATILSAQRKFDEAETLARDALATTRRTLGPGHYQVGVQLSQLGEIVRRRGRRDEAERLLRQALEVLRASTSARSSLTATTASRLGQVLLARGDLRGAEPLLREAVSLLAELAPNDPERGPAEQALAALEARTR